MYKDWEDIVYPSPRRYNYLYRPDEVLPSPRTILLAPHLY